MNISVITKYKSLLDDSISWDDFASFIQDNHSEHEWRSIDKFLLLPVGDEHSEQLERMEATFSVLANLVDTLASSDLSDLNPTEFLTFKTELRDSISEILYENNISFLRSNQDDQDFGKYVEDNPSYMLDKIQTAANRIYSLEYDCEAFIYDKILAKLPKGLSYTDQYAWFLKKMQHHFPSFTNPYWIQDGGWPMGKESPMSFMGQIHLQDCGYYHDETSLYVFFDTKTGEYKVIKQSY
jgi:hypothetical protein